MALAVSHTFVDQETLTHTLLNAIETNIVNIALSLISPLTGALDCGSRTLDDIGPLSNIDMGTGTGDAVLIGLANLNVTAVGNIGAGEDDLMTYALPANSLSANGKAVRVHVWGTTAANANTKTIKFWFGVTERTINPTTTAPNNQHWQCDATIVRTGASAQLMVLQGFVGTAYEQQTSNDLPTANEVNAITIKCTGNSAASATDDIVQRGMLVEFLN